MKLNFQQPLRKSGKDTEIAEGDTSPLGGKSFQGRQVTLNCVVPLVDT